MQVIIFGTIAVNPLSFPDDLDLLIFPLRTHDGSPACVGNFGGFDHYTWEQIQLRYKTTPEQEALLRAGEMVSVQKGRWITANFPDDMKFPDGVEIISQV